MPPIKTCVARLIGFPLERLYHFKHHCMRLAKSAFKTGLQRLTGFRGSTSSLVGKSRYHPSHASVAIALLFPTIIFLRSIDTTYGSTEFAEVIGTMSQGGRGNFGFNWMKIKREFAIQND